MVGASKANKTFGSTTLDVTKKVVQFGAVTAAIRGVTTGMGAMVQQTFELDSALTEFKKVSDLSGKGLEKYTEQAYELGGTVAKTGQEMIEAATEFRKAGYNDQDAMQLGRIASMYQNVADQELSAGEAANFITSQMKAYNIEARDAEHIIDGVNQVSNNFAVSSADIAVNIGKASAALAQGNVSYEESIGLMTAITEITRNGSTAARGLVSIQSRFNQITDETSSTGKKLTAWYEKHNIAIRDQNGNLKSFFEVGKDVSKIWNQLSKDEQMYYLNTQAGANQSRNLAALMRNYGTAIEAAETALHSEGSAARENARYMDSLKGKLKELQSAWSKFSNAMVDSDMVKKALSGLTKLLEFLSTDFGQGMIKAALGFTMFTGAFKLFSSMALSLAPTFGRIGKAFGAYNKNLAKVHKNSNKVSKGLRNLPKTFSIMPKPIASASTAFGALGMTTGGVVALAAGVGLLSVALAKFVPIGGKADKILADNKFEKSKEELEELEGKYKSVSDEIIGLETKRDSGSLSAGEEHRLQVLKEQERVLERQLKLKRETNKSDFNEKARTPDVSSLSGGALFQKQRGNRSVTDEQLTKELGIFTELDAKVAEHRSSLLEASKQYSSYLRLLNTNPEKALEAYDKYQESLGGMGDAIQGVKDKQKEWLDQYGSFKEMPEDIQKSYLASKNMTDTWDTLVSKVGKLDFSKMTDLQWEGLQNNFKDLGANIGMIYNDAGKLSTINLEQFSSAMSAAGFSAAEVETALHRITEENPEAHVMVSGTEVAQEDLDSVIQYLGAVGGAEEHPSVSVDNAIYTIGQLELIDGKLQTIDDHKDINAEVDFKSTGGDKVSEDVENLNSLPKKVTSTLTVTGQVDESAENASAALKDGDKEVQKTLVVTGVDNGAMPLVDTINNQSIPPKTMQVGGKLAQSFTNAKSQYEKVPKTKSSTLTIGGKLTSSFNSVVNKLKSVKASLGFAKGTHSAPEGLAEVNEQGWEFIRDAKTGQLRIAGGGERTVTYLNKGDAVYTHGESLSMISQAEDVQIPQHKKGKKKKQKGKKKKQKKYDKSYKNISQSHERTMKELELQAKREHWSDAQLARAKKAQLDATNQKIAALNKKYGKKINKQSLMDTLDAEFDIYEAKLEEEHAAQVKAIEKAMTGEIGYRTDLSSIVDQINNSARLSAEEREKYLQEAYKSNIEYLQKLFDKNKKTYSEMESTIKDYYAQGMITSEEYYDYLDDLADKQLDKERERLSKLNEAKQNEYDLAKAYVQHQIDKLEEQNDLIEKQSDLEKARSQRIKVYRQGVGFVYEQDVQAIREAEKAMSSVAGSPEMQKWQDILDLFDDMESLAEMKDLENKLGITKEELVGGMGTDLARWESFIRANLATKLGYENLLDAMDELEGHEAITTWLQGVGETISQSQIDEAIDRNRFASGTLNAPAGFARVAENGYEIALLGKGDAVMPHNVSENLMKWGRYNPVEVMRGGLGGSVENFHFDKLILPNVANANDFIRELHNLPNRALQHSRSRG